jgi:hypothetical protein
MDNFKDRVKQSTPIEGLSSYVMKTGAKDIVTLSGSFLGGALYSQSHKEQAATITASMLDWNRLGQKFILCLTGITHTFQRIV